MGENIVTSLVNHIRELKRAQDWQKECRRDLEDAAVQYSGATDKVVDSQNRVRKLESSIKAVWGEEALEIAWKAVRED